MRTYNVAPMDLAARIGTVFFHVLMVTVITVIAVRPDGRPMLWGFAFLAIGSWYCLEIAPKRYDVTDEAMVIVRGRSFSKISIPLNDIREVRRVKLSPWSTIRTFGVGGVFSYSGRFRARNVGKFYGAITDLSRTVLIEAGKKYVISPEDPAQFVEEIQGIHRNRRQSTQQ